MVVSIKISVSGGRSFCQPRILGNPTEVDAVETVVVMVSAPIDVLTTVTCNDTLG